MGQPVPNPPPGFDALSIEEKIEYVESLWDRVVEQTPAMVPEWQSELVRERLAAYRDDPGQGRSWQEVKADLERKYPDPR